MIYFPDLQLYFSFFDVFALKRIEFITVSNSRSGSQSLASISTFGLTPKSRKLLFPCFVAYSNDFATKFLTIRKGQVTIYINVTLERTVLFP